MFVVFDLETTGFNSRTDDIIQFAYIAFDGAHAIRAEVLYFYYEGMSWSEEAYEVHRIPLEFLRQHKDDFQKNLIRMFTVLGGANVCGFNNEYFDCPFVKSWLSRMGLPGLEYRVIQDVMAAYRPITHQHKIKLIKLSDMMGLTPENINRLSNIWFKGDAGDSAHDAAYDTTATALLTLQGLAKGLISFDDSAVVEKEITRDKEEVTTSQVLGVSDDVKRRDPKGILVHLMEDDMTRPYILCSDKNTYATSPPLPHEVESMTANTKLISTPFHPAGENVWEYTGANGEIYTLYIGELMDTLHVKFPSRDNPIKVF